jgi:site-specific DNA-methyltransferase (adenine-specific)
MARMPDNFIDLLLQDTPFGCTQNEWDIKPDLQLMWPKWNRVTKQNGAMLFFATQPFASELILSNAKNFRYDLIWYKALGSGFLNANRMPLRNHETILVFYRLLPTYNPQMKIGKMRERGRRGGEQSSNYGKYHDQISTNNQYFPQSVLDFTNGDRTKESEHPTQKPIQLIQYLIKTYSNENDLVYDGYAGSGTTAHACILEKRNWILSEISEEYCKIAEKRIDPYLRQTTLL